MQGDSTMNTASQAIAIGALLILRRPGRRRGAGRRSAPRARVDRHRRDRPGRLSVDGASARSMRTASTSRGWSRRRSARAARSTSSGSSTATSRTTPTWGRIPTGTPRPTRCGRSRSRGPSTVRGRGGRGADGRLRLDRPVRAARRPEAAVRPGLGRDRGPRPGPARRPRHPAEAPRLLHRRAEQDVERRCLQLHRGEPPGPVDHRGELHLSRLVRRRQPGGRVGEHGVRGGARRRPRRARGVLRGASWRARSRWATARRSAVAARRSDGSVATGLGR